MALGTLQILDVRKGQGPQAHGRGNRDDRAVFRLGGPVQQGRQLLRTERDMQVLHRVLSSGELGMRSGARVPIPRGREPAVRAAFRAFLER